MQFNISFNGTATYHAKDESKTLNHDTTKT